MHQLKQIIIVQVFMQLFRNSFEFFKVNNSVLVFIENGKYSADSILGLGLSNF
jgi:hypothetical protein